MHPGLLRKANVLALGSARATHAAVQEVLDAAVHVDVVRTDSYLLSILATILHEVNGILQSNHGRRNSTCRLWIRKLELYQQNSSHTVLMNHITKWEVPIWIGSHVRRGCDSNNTAKDVRAQGGCVKRQGACFVLAHDSNREILGADPSFLLQPLQRTNNIIGLTCTSRSQSTCRSTASIFSTTGKIYLHQTIASLKQPSIYGIRTPASPLRLYISPNNKGAWSSLLRAQDIGHHSTFSAIKSNPVSLHLRVPSESVGSSICTKKRQRCGANALHAVFLQSSSQCHFCRKLRVPIGRCQPVTIALDPNWLHAAWWL
mmetsp:Transcript_24498/g.56937  ORF Transcript_24498/g.56937 Transcript_24498/m.56937 type:complete len:316 (-) Transcript_24498:700-1647(-)